MPLQLHKGSPVRVNNFKVNRVPSSRNINNKIAEDLLKKEIPKDPGREIRRSIVRFIARVIELTRKQQGTSLVLSFKRDRHNTVRAKETTVSEE